jgi:hypothetical protein
VLKSRHQGLWNARERNCVVRITEDETSSRKRPTTEKIKAK